MDGLEREREREKRVKNAYSINWRSLVLSRTVRAGFFTSDVRHVLCGSSRQYAKQNFHVAHVSRKNEYLLLLTSTKTYI